MRRSVLHLVVACVLAGAFIAEPAEGTSRAPAADTGLVGPPRPAATSAVRDPGPPPGGMLAADPAPTLRSAERYTGSAGRGVTHRSAARKRGSACDPPVCILHPGAIGAEPGDVARSARRRATLSLWSTATPPPSTQR